MSRVVSPIIDCCATWSTSSGCASAKHQRGEEAKRRDGSAHFSPPNVRAARRSPNRAGLTITGAITSPSARAPKDRDPAYRRRSARRRSRARPARRSRPWPLPRRRRSASGSSQPPSTSEASAGPARPCAVRRVEKGERERPPGGRRTEPRRVGAPDPRHPAERERLDIGAKNRPRLGAVVDEEREAGAARQRLDRERPRSGEQIDHPRALDMAGKSVLENVEDRFAQPLRGRADGARRRRREHAALETAADDPHRFTAFAAGGAGRLDLSAVPCRAGRAVAPARSAPAARRPPPLRLAALRRADRSDSRSPLCRSGGRSNRRAGGAPSRASCAVRAA